MNSVSLKNISNGVFLGTLGLLVVIGLLTQSCGSSDIDCTCEPTPEETPTNTQPPPRPTPTSTETPVATPTEMPSPTPTPVTLGYCGEEPVDDGNPCKVLLCHVPENDTTEAQWKKLSKQRACKHLRKHEYDYLGGNVTLECNESHDSDDEHENHENDD